MKWWLVCQVPCPQEALRLYPQVVAMTLWGWLHWAGVLSTQAAKYSQGKLSAHQNEQQVAAFTSACVEYGTQHQKACSQLGRAQSTDNVASWPDPA